jgi:hypothetical protein
MDEDKSLIRHDPHARVRYVFTQQLQTFIAMQYTPRDPHERFAERVSELELAYTACPHYLQSDFRENYAKKHARELIKRRDEIMENFRALHDDGEFVEFLKQSHPDLYAFAKWETVCLALAEKHEAAHRDDGTPINAPPKRRRTAEEVRAKKVRDQQIQIDDKIALAQARLESLTRARQILNEHNLEDLGLGELEKELTADIMIPEQKDDPNDYEQY